MFLNRIVQIIVGILIALGFLVTPTTLIWGWTSWTRQPKQKTLSANLSLIGFILATASAMLAVSSLGYGQVHGFLPWDRLLVRIFLCGVSLSLAGLLFGIGGMWRPGALRWQAPLCGLGTLAFWFLGALGWENSLF